MSGKRLAVRWNSQRVTHRNPARSSSSSMKSNVNGVRTDPYQMIWVISFPLRLRASSSGI
jgi:hypothetical protein